MKLRRAATAMANVGTTAPRPGSPNASASACNLTARQFDALYLHFNRQLWSEGASVVHGRTWKVSCEGCDVWKEANWLFSTQHNSLQPSNHSKHHLTTEKSCQFLTNQISQLIFYNNNQQLELNQPDIDVHHT